MRFYIQTVEEWIKENQLPDILIAVGWGKMRVVLKRRPRSKPELMSAHETRVGAWLGLIKAVLRMP